MRIIFVRFFVISFLPILGCTPRLVATIEIEDHLYLEYFNVNPAGVENAYLTDSVNFRINIGQYDTDHERIRCELKGDTLVIIKRRVVGGQSEIIDQKELSREYLVKNKVNKAE